MKALKVIGATLLAVLVLILAIAFFLPSKVHVERSATIKASPDLIFSQVNTLTNWEAWSPWRDMDPEIQMIYSARATGEGASYEWKSNNKNIGQGRVTIVKSSPFEYIGTEMDLGKNGKIKGAYTFVQNDNGTKVTWSIDSDMGMNPFARYYGLMMDRMMGPVFETGLANLRNVCEKSSVTELSTSAVQSDSSATTVK